MELIDFKNKLKTGELSGWYIFAGEEDYLKKYYLKSLHDAVVSDEAFALFNYASYDGAQIDFASVKEAITSPPMMGDYKLIEWRFADLDGLKEGDKSALESLFDLRDGYPYAIFAIMTTADGFDVGTPKKPSKLASRLSSGFDIISFPKSSDAQLLAWLKKHFDAEGVAVDAQTLSAMLFRVGHSMDVLNNEVIKLCCYAKANKKNFVTPTDVDEVCSSTVECDAFALSNAITDKNITKAFTTLTDLKMRRIEPTAIIAMLERTYCELTSVALMLEEGADAKDIETLLKLHPFKAKLAIGAAKKLGIKKIADSLSDLRKIDASSKSGGINGYGAIEMFITQNI